MKEKKSNKNTKPRAKKNEEKARDHHLKVMLNPQMGPIPQQLS